MDLWEGVPDFRARDPHSRLSKVVRVNRTEPIGFAHDWKVGGRT